MVFRTANSNSFHVVAPGDAAKVRPESLTNFVRQETTTLFG